MIHKLMVKVFVTKTAVLSEIRQIRTIIVLEVALKMIYNIEELKT